MKYYWWKFELSVIVLLGRGLVILNKELEKYYKKKGDLVEAFEISNRTNKLAKKLERWSSLIA